MVEPFCSVGSMHQMRKAHWKRGYTIQFQEPLKKAHKTHFQQPVEGNHRSQQAREELNDREDAEGDPVNQPLGVVLLRAGLDGMDGDVGGVQHSNDVAQQLGAIAEDEIEGDESSSTWKE